MRTKLKFVAIAPLLIAGPLVAQTPARLLTRAEIAAAIQKSIDANGFSVGAPLSASDISLAADVMVSESRPALTVTRMESRPGATSTNVALWTSSEPRTPPFWVTVDRAIAEPDANEIAAKPSAEKSGVEPPETPSREMPIHYVARAPIRTHALARADSNGQPLVRVGTPLQLIVQGAGMRITANAKALETGREGQQIRVQCEPAGKVLVARIVSAEIAEIDY